MSSAIETIATSEASEVITWINTLNFRQFVYKVFSQSFDGEFVKGQYILDCCERLASNQNTIEITARDHFKSTRIYAYLMWLMLTATDNVEVQYFSFNERMAGYHMVKLKDMIDGNVWCQALERAGHLLNQTPTAKTLVEYINPLGAKITIHPRGMKSFARGVHADVIIIDDPFPDAKNKATPTEISNVNHIVRASIFSMVKDAGSIHIVGTPQTEIDFFFDKELEGEFNITIKPAILNDKTKEVLWPEWMDYGKLMTRQKRLGIRLFNQEYMASPAYSENSFLQPELVKQAIDLKLKPCRKYDGDADVVAGFDIGKKAHPSHIAVFKKEDGIYTQLYSKWMDKWDYTAQVEFAEQLIEDLKIDTMYYDATRGELEALEEQGKLPYQFEPVHFTTKKRHAMATILDINFANGTIKLLNDARQYRQLLSVNNELQAVESPEGHGDSFWSAGMGLLDYDKDPQISVIGA